MALGVKCPHCGKVYRVSAEFAGKKAKCAACGRPFLIPHRRGEEKSASRAETAGTTTTGESSLPRPRARAKLLLGLLAVLLILGGGAAVALFSGILGTKEGASPMASKEERVPPPHQPLEQKTRARGRQTAATERRVGAGDKHVTVAGRPRFSSTTREAVLLRYKLKPGQVFVMDLDAEIKTELRVPGRGNVKIPIDMTMAAKCEVERVAANGDASAVMTFTRITLDSSGPATLSYDSDADGDAVMPQLKHLATLVHNPIPVKVTELGKVLDMDMHVLYDAMRRAGAAAMMQELKNTADQMVQSTFVQLSPDPVKAGDTYDAGEIVQVVPQVGEMHNAISYEILSVSADRTKALLRPMSTFELKPLAGAPVNVKLESGHMDGWILFDLERGNIMRSAARVVTVMSISAGGQTMPVTTEVEFKYRVRYE